MGAEKYLEISRAEQDNWDTVVIENDFFRTVLIPKCGRLPYSFYCKNSGQECFAHPVPLSTPQNGQEFNYYGGLIDSIPWVSGKVNGKTDPQRFPVKGYLHFSPWKSRLEKRRGEVCWEGENTFTYNEPVTDKLSSLTFVKKITAYADSAKLRMDYRIKNTGTGNAKFTLAVHSRTCIGNWHRGTYFYAPGDKCYLYELENRPDLEAKGMKLFSWTDWPFEEARHLQPAPETAYLFTYHPQDWCVTGDALSKKAFFYIAGGPVNYGDRTDILKMGSFMTNKVQFVQPCVSYALQSDAEIWKQPGAVAELPEGGECVFTLYLVAHAGIEENAVVNLHRVNEDFLLLDEPELTAAGTGAVIRGAAVFSTGGEISVKINGKTFKRVEIPVGAYNFEQLGIIPFPENITLEFNDHDNSREITISQMG
ncbi:MAG: hypothetical protein PHV82_12030 [Victivallaceae bacterium]|nr:hypothetical protein [Victivallaceae bacterium]